MNGKKREMRVHGYALVTEQRQIARWRSGHPFSLKKLQVREGDRPGAGNSGQLTWSTFRVDTRIGAIDQFSRTQDSSVRNELKKKRAQSKSRLEDTCSHWHVLVQPKQSGKIR